MNSNLISGSMRPLVLLFGFKGSGKSTAAMALEEAGYFPLSFADGIKDALAAIFCWPRDMLEGKTTESRIWREQVDVWWAEKLGIPNFSPRFAMSNFGTDVMRQYFHDDIWILNVERRMEQSARHIGIVLVDGRHPKEVEMARKHNGMVFRIRRGVEPDWYETALKANRGDEGALHEMMMSDVHISEWELVGTPCDEIIENDRTPELLHAKILKAIRTKSHM